MSDDLQLVPRQCALLIEQKGKVPRHCTEPAELCLVSRGWVEARTLLCVAHQQTLQNQGYVVKRTTVPQPIKESTE